MFPYLKCHEPVLSLRLQAMIARDKPQAGCTGAHLYGRNRLALSNPWPLVMCIARADGPSAVPDPHSQTNYLSAWTSNLQIKFQSSFLKSVPHTPAGMHTSARTQTTDACALCNMMPPETCEFFTF